MIKKPLLVLCVSSISTFAHANINETFSPYVSAGYSYDSNMFRLQNEQIAQAVLGTTNMSETYHIIAAGLNMNWKLNRQVIEGHAEFNQVGFDTYKNLDYNGRDLGLKWNWLVKDTLSGDAGVSETVMLGTFTNIKKPINNLITKRKAYLNTHIKLDHRWLLKVGGSKMESTNSDPIAYANDYTIDSLDAGFQYLTPKGSKIDFTSAVSDGNYPNRQLVGSTPVDNSYTQFDNGMGLDWIAAGKTKIHGRINYTRRNYPDVPQRNFSGVTGRISTDLAITGKTSLNFALYREIGAYDTNISSYTLTQGAALNATWLANAKVTVNLRVSHDNIDYQGDSTIALTGTPLRKDELNKLGLGVTYQILRNTKLDVSAERGVRHSNTEGYSYRYNSITLGLSSAF